jgi:Cu(I)/Ag(I) efflux system protein CusF
VTISMHGLVTAALVLVLPFAAQAAGSAPAVQANPAASESAATDLTDGEVRKVDKANARLTLRHAEIKNLDMPGMTMVFDVKDPTWIDAFQPGDKVRFKALREGGRFIVTEIVPVR